MIRAGPLHALTNKARLTIKQLKVAMAHCKKLATLLQLKDNYAVIDLYKAIFLIIFAITTK